MKKKIMRRVAKFIFDFFEVYLGVAVLAILLLSIFVQVFMRYVLNEPSPELFELSIYCFVWVIYLGGALAVRYNQHVRFDILYQSFSPRVKSVLDIIFDLLTNFVLLVLFYPSAKYTLDMYPIKASALRVPWTFLLGVFPIFVALVLIHNFTNIVKNVLKLSGREVKEMEPPPWL